MFKIVFLIIALISINYAENVKTMSLEDIEKLEILKITDSKGLKKYQDLALEKKPILKKRQKRDHSSDNKSAQIKTKVVKADPKLKKSKVKKKVAKKSKPKLVLKKKIKIKKKPKQIISFRKKNKKLDYNFLPFDMKLRFFIKNFNNISKEEIAKEIIKSSKAIKNLDMKAIKQVFGSKNFTTKDIKDLLNSL